MDNEKYPTKQCEDIQQMKVLLPKLEDKVNKLDEKVAKQEDAIGELYKFQGGTKVYVAEIKDQINRLEGRLFGFMSDLVNQLANSNTIETKTASEERKKSSKDWMEFAKWIIGATVVALIAYIFNNGGK